jgi:hypothetical protein
LDQHTQNKLDRRVQLVIKANERSIEEDQELRKITDELAASGFAHEFRDAHYDLFAKAMGRVRYADRVTLTREEIADLEKEAEGAVRSLQEVSTS